MDINEFYLLMDEYIPTPLPRKCVLESRPPGMMGNLRYLSVRVDSPIPYEDVNDLTCIPSGNYERIVIVLLEREKLSDLATNPLMVDVVLCLDECFENHYIDHAKCSRICMGTIYNNAKEAYSNMKKDVW